MKKEWYYSWSRSSVPRGVVETCRDSSSSNSTTTTPGCMGGMMHYLLFAPGAGCVGRPPSDIVHSYANDVGACHTKGLEAPRNSLELDECTAAAAVAAVVKNSGGGEEFKDIPIGIQIVPAFDALARSSKQKAAVSSEAETPRTPSLVARLMGFDGLPEQAPSPSPALRKPVKEKACNEMPRKEEIKEKKKRVIVESTNKELRQPLRSLSCNIPAGGLDIGSGSLPDTPRPSTSARASWDMDHRLSLQIHKENNRGMHDLAYLSKSGSGGSDRSLPPSSPVSCGAKQRKKDHRRPYQDENNSLSQRTQEYAREIVKQAKETVTNRRSGGGDGGKSKKASRGVEKKENTSFDVEDKFVQTKPKVAAAGPSPPASSPPPAKWLEPPKGQMEHHIPNQQVLPKPPRAKPSRPPPPPPPLEPRAAPAAGKCKKDGCERFATRIKKPSRPPPPPPPPLLAADNSGPSNLTDGKCSASSSTRLLIHSPQRHHHQKSKKSASSTPTSPVPLEQDPEYRYVRTVLERGGFMRISSSSFKGYSTSAPVDPIIFHLLELELPAEEGQLGPLRYRWNRKLLFHLVQEILADLLLGTAPSGERFLNIGGPPLMRWLWGKIRSFPAADCQVVGDIDALVAGDLPAAKVRQLLSHPAVAVDEAGDVAGDVAERVLDDLLGEAAASLSLSSSSSSRVSR